MKNSRVLRPHQKTTITAVITPSCMKENERRVGNREGSEPKLLKLEVVEIEGFAINCNNLEMKVEKDRS